MSACLVVLYWPDFAETLPGSPAVSPHVVAHALRRNVVTRFSNPVVYTWLGEHGCAAAAFRRAGFELLEHLPGPEVVAALAREYPYADHAVLVMEPERSELAAVRLQELGRTVECLVPASCSPVLSPLDGVSYRPLDEALNLATVHTVGLFVDREAVEAAGPHASTEDAPSAEETLRRVAELVGLVTEARTFSDAVGMEDELRRLLQDPAAPETWILVSQAQWLSGIIRQAHSRGIRCLLWSPVESQVSTELRAQADGFAPLSGVLQPDKAPLVPLPETSGSGIYGAVRVTMLTEPKAVPPVETGPDGSLPQQPGTSARLGAWVRLVYHVECTLRRHRWSRIAFRRLAGALAELEEFGPTAANAMMWLNRAKAEGMLLGEQEVHRTDPSLRVTTCRPNPEHPVSKAAVEVPDRCLRLLYQMLQKMPWVSFKLLRNVLLREQWLGGPPFQLDETGVDEWLNFLIHDAAITMTKEPNLANPEFPVTALRLNEEHPLSRTVVAEAVEGARLAAERAILAVDHFLTRNRKPWMAMSALRRALDGMGREELQEVLQGLQKLGALVTESYPNPQKEHFTTGCRLRSDQPLVAGALHTRNTIIRVTQVHHRQRSWVPLSCVEEDLAAHQWAGSSRSHRLAWFLLLRDEGILELDHDGIPPEDAWPRLHCRLNVADAVVRAVVAEHPLDEPVEALR